MQKIAKQIEALLFYKAEPVDVARLASHCNISAKEVRDAFEDIEAHLEESGLTLVRTNDTATIATSPEHTAFIERVREEELQAHLGKAGLETLTVILYRGPIAKADIDYIRGVNSRATIRTLTTRGLIEGTPNPENKRQTLYSVTTDALRHLGISDPKEAPGYHTVNKKIETIWEDNERTGEPQNPFVE